MVVNKYLSANSTTFEVGTINDSNGVYASSLKITGDNAVRVPLTLQLGNSGGNVTSLQLGANTSVASGAVIANIYNASNNPGITVGTSRTDGTAFTVANGITYDANKVPNSGGTALLTVLGGGNVGVGTTSPYALLALSNSVSTPANTPFFTISSTTGGTSTSTLMTVLANGYVGIGTASPGRFLDVVASTTAGTEIARFTNTPVSNRYISVRTVGASDFGGAYIGGPMLDSSDPQVIFGKNLLLPSNGANIALAQSSLTSSSAGGTVLTSGGSTAQAGTTIQLGNSSTFQGNLYVKDGSGNTVMTVQPTGNVGIGATAPTSPLTVVTPSLWGNGAAGENLGVTVNPSANGTLYGLFNLTSVTATTTTGNAAVVGSQNTVTATNNNGGNTTLTAVSGTTNNTGGGSASQMTGFFTNPAVYNTGSSVSSLYNFYANDVYLGNGTSQPFGSVNKLYGYYVGALQSASTNYGLFFANNPNGGSIASAASTNISILPGSGGSVGIGTTSPWAQLSVNPNGIAGPAFAIGSSTATNFVVTNGGNVGINTVNATNALTFGATGGYEISTEPNNANDLNITTNATNGGGISLGARNSNKSIYVSIGGGVGIGTTSPRAALEIGGSANPSVYLNSQYSTPSTMQWYIPNIATMSLVANAVGNENANAQWVMDMGSSDGLTDSFGVLRASTVGSTRVPFFVVNNNGNTGIGTTTPGGDLSIAGSAGGTNPLFLISSSTSGYATSTAFMVDSYGSLGIGRVPNAQLSVAGDAYIGTGAGSFTFTSNYNFNAQGTNFGPSLNISDGDATNRWASLRLSTAGGQWEMADMGGNLGFLRGSNNRVVIGRSDSSNANLNVYNDANTILFTVQPTGYVGIGPSNPVNQLDIGIGPFATAKTANFSTLNIANTATSSSSFTKTGMQISSTGAWTGPNYGLYVSAVSGGTNNYDAIFNGGGNVGIGTTTPSDLLSLASTNPRIDLFDTNVSGPARVALTAYGGTNANAALQTRTNVPLIFGANSSASQLVLATNGNVGIGTTTPGKPLTIAATGSGPSIGTGMLSLVGPHNTTARPEIFFQNSAAGTTYTGGLRWYDGNGNEGWGIESNRAIGTGYLEFNIAGSNKMVLDPSGNVGIGSTSPTYTLSVDKGSVGNQAAFGHTAKGYLYDDGTNFWLSSAASVAGPGIGFAQSLGTAYLTYATGQVGFTMDNSGNVGIGRSPGVRLDVQGVNSSSIVRITAGGAGVILGADVAGNALYGNSAYGTALTLSAAGALRLNAYGAGTLTTDASGNVTASSDARLKNVDGGYTRGLEAIRGLSPQLYHWNAASGLDQTTQYAGFIAQNVRQYIPEAVGQTPSGYLTLADRPIEAALVNAVQQLDNRTSWIQVASSSATTTPVLTFDPTTGRVGIGSTTPTHTLTVAGDVGAIAFVNTSTRDAKTDISYVNASTTEDMLNALVNLKVATYHYKVEPETDPLRLGFIAEDAAKIAPEILSPDGKGVDLYKLATFTLAGVQSLAAKVDVQGTKITSLEQRVAALESGAVSVGSSAPQLSTSSLASAISSITEVLNIGKLVSQTFYAAQGFFDRLTAANATIGSSSTPSGVTFFDTVTKQPFCFTIANGVPTTTPGVCATSNETTNPFATSTPAAAAATSSPISVLGANPLLLAVGATFTDPGVTVASGAAVTTFVNGIQQVVSSTTISTLSPTTYIITYQSTDATGALISATRSVIVGNPDGTVSTGVSTTTATSTPITIQTVATSTTASSSPITITPVDTTTTASTTSATSTSAL